MSADRDALRDLLGAAEASESGQRSGSLRAAIARTRRHLDRTPDDTTAATLAGIEQASSLREVVAHNVRRAADLITHDAEAHARVVARAQAIATGEAPVYGPTL